MTAIQPKRKLTFIEEAIKDRKPPKYEFDVDKFFGKIRWEEDALKFQRDLR